MSKEYQIKPGSRIELVIFEPQRKIKLSRSTYKVNSYIDFKPYKETFKQYGHYMNRLIIDLHDPPIKIGMNVKKSTSEPLVVNRPHTNTVSRISTYN